MTVGWRDQLVEAGKRAIMESFRVLRDGEWKDAPVEWEAWAEDYAETVIDALGIRYAATMTTGGYFPGSQSLFSIRAADTPTEDAPKEPDNG